MQKKFAVKYHYSWGKLEEQYGFLKYEFWNINEM